MKNDSIGFRSYTEYVGRFRVVKKRRKKRNRHRRLVGRFLGETTYEKGRALQRIRRACVGIM